MMETPPEWENLEHTIGDAQQCFAQLMMKWKRKYFLHLTPSTTIKGLKLWHKQQSMVIPPDESLK